VADRAAGHVGVQHKTAVAVFRLLRLSKADLTQARFPFFGVIEVDKSYCRPTCLSRAFTALAKSANAPIPNRQFSPTLLVSGLAWQAF
jgi:hypothetical protein